MSGVIQNKYEFVIYFDVENGNPNGNPDAGNLPRVDYETGHGLVTDVCLKRKIRDYVEMIKEDDPRYRIYIKRGVPLNRSDNEAFESVGIRDAAAKNSKELQKLLKEAKSEKNIDMVIKDYMCENFFDIRTFGAVMTTMVKAALNCGQVRGPVQLGFAKSADPVITQDIAITRVAITTEDDAEKKQNEMGSKYIVPYGLYRCEGYVSANLAQKVTGFSEDDLELLWQAILNMFEFDRSAARGNMATRKLIIFKHPDQFGKAPAHKLFELVKAVKREGVSAPRSYSDYEITVDMENLPEGVSCEVRE